MTEPRITPVPPAFVDCVWAEVMPFITEAVRKSAGRFSVESVREDALRGFHTLWIAVMDEKIVLVISTRVVQYPLRRGLIVEWAGGGRLMDVIGAYMHELRAYARENKCDHIEGSGRRGWSKALALHGWSIGDVSYKLEIEDAG